MISIEKLITQLKIHYGENCIQDGANHWLFEVMTTSNRSQVVHLYYKKMTHSQKDTSRLITFSPIGPVFRHFEYEKVLRKNSVLDVGAICIEDLKSDNNLSVPYLVLRASHIASTIDYDEAWELIDKTGIIADELEDEIFAKDIY